MPVRTARAAIAAVTGGGIVAVGAVTAAPPTHTQVVAVHYRDAPVAAAPDVHYRD